MVIGVCRNRRAYSCNARFYIDGPQSRITYYNAEPDAKYYTGVLAFSPPTEPALQRNTNAVGETGRRKHYNGSIGFPAPGDEICGSEEDMAGWTLYEDAVNNNCECDNGDGIGLTLLQGETCPEPDELGNVQCDIVEPCCTPPDGYIEAEEQGELELGGDTFIHIHDDDERHELASKKETTGKLTHIEGCQCELCKQARKKG